MYSLTGERSFELDSFFAPTARRDQLVLKSADEALKDQVDAIKEEWRLLWLDRIDDKVRAEGIANQCFSLLSVERGTVIVATRAFKPLDLREILSLHHVQNVERIVGPYPSVGGWTKFARTVLNKQARARRMDRAVQCRKCVKGMQLKKCGRGWLHRS